MKEEKHPMPEDPEVDRRERFVLRGGTEGIAESVPAAPEATIDIERALRSIGDPERPTRVRRYSGL